MENFIDTLIIIEKHFKASKGSLDCVYMAMELAPYYEKLALLDSINPSLVVPTVLHDYKGLSEDIDGFLPRLF